MIRPILFNTEMVRAILGGRKTVTRRAIRPQPEGKPILMAENSCYPGCFGIGRTPMVIRPPCQPGDILWVRETWAERPYGFVYKADGDEPEGWDHDDHWRPSIHMKKEAARLFLRVIGVRAERLQKISAKQARMEGQPRCNGGITVCGGPRRLTMKTPSYGSLIAGTAQSSPLTAPSMVGEPTHGCGSSNLSGAKSRGDFDVPAHYRTSPYRRR